MKKDNKDHIHLDGECNNTFFMYNGNINWTLMGHATYGIEIRNPKNMYCMDGKEYEGETHQGELVDSATAEAWISAGVLPTGKTIDSKITKRLRMTAKVREALENLTKYCTEINSVISTGTTEEIKQAIADRFDVNTFIDYILLCEITNNKDCYGNNGQFTTWGKPSGYNKVPWCINVYDCDISFGTGWMGNIANSPDNNNIFGNTHYPFNYFLTYFRTELESRYKELRDCGIFTADHITNLFKDWMSRVGNNIYAKEFEKWIDCPCFRDGSCNNGWERISDSYISLVWDDTTPFAQDAIVKYNYKIYKSKVSNNVGHNPQTDDGTYWENVFWDENKNYAVGDICYYGKWEYYPFEATSATTGVQPLKHLYNTYPGELGFYGSVYRIYNFMIEEIDSLDSQLNYN